MKPTVDKVHKSTIATEKLKSAQYQMGMPELRAKQQVVTGGSQLRQVLESKDAIISIVAFINAPVDALSQEEWEEVGRTYTVLETFEQINVEIGADRYTGQFNILLIAY